MNKFTEKKRQMNNMGRTWKELQEITGWNAHES